MVSVNSNISSRSVWVTLKQGSLIINGDAGEVETVQWPTEGEIRAIVQDIHQMRSRNEEDNGVTRINLGAPRQQTTADRVQDALDPFKVSDPWRPSDWNNAQESPQAQEDHHQSRGIRLVTEKNLNTQPTLRGTGLEQHNPLQEVAPTHGGLH